MSSLLHFLYVTHISHASQSVGGGGWVNIQCINAVRMCRWMYNRVLDKVLTVGRAATEGSATYNQLAQYVVSDVVSVSMFTVLLLKF